MDLSALEPAHLQTVTLKRDLFDRGLRRIIEQGMKAGTAAPGDPKLLTSPSWGRPTGSPAGTTEGAASSGPDRRELRRLPAGGAWGKRRGLPGPVAGGDTLSV